MNSCGESTELFLKIYFVTGYDIWKLAIICDRRLMLNNLYYF